MPIKSHVLIALGSLSLALGAIGLLLPVLPTTPFLLLASFFYLHSSKKLYKWLLSRKTLGKYIYNYMTYRAVSRSAKILSVISLWTTLSISSLMINSWLVRVLLLLVGLAVSAHLLRLKVIKKSKTCENMNYE